MLKFFIGLIFFILPIHSVVAFDLRYQIHHDVVDSTKPKLKITCTINPRILNLERFKKNNKHFFYLQLPEQWSSAKNLEAYITNLHIIGNNSHIVDLKDKSLKKIIIESSSQFITLSYEVYPKKQVDLLEPMINDQIFHFIGHAVLIYPKINLKKLIDIKLESSSSLKTNIILANSFGLGSVQQVNLSLKAFQHAAFAGGAYQKDSIQSDNTMILSYGLQEDTKNYIVEVLNKIVPIHKNFWSEKKDKNNLIFVHANDLAKTSLSGTRTTGAISILINETTPFFKEDLPVFLAHEYWHTWMGGEFYSAYSYKYMAWLFEGVTDYYAHKTNYLAKTLDAQSWVDKYNRILTKQYLSSVRNKSNQDIIDYFDEDMRYSDLPYTRGKIIAFELDNRIQKLSNNQYSLDDVLKNLFSDKKNHAITLKNFEDSLRLFYPDARNFVKLYVKNGEDLPLSPTIFGQEAKLNLVKIKPENYGLDLKSTFINKIVSGVSEKSTAYQKGLRNGQKVISYQVNYDDINKPILLKIVSNHHTESHFLLERDGLDVLVPQYQISKGE